MATAAPRCFNILFICPSNSTRSIIAESLLNCAGIGRFNAFSAGRWPATRVHPQTIELLLRKRCPVERPTPRCWLEYAWRGAVELDFVIDLSQGSLGSKLPAWRGYPYVARWDIDDPEMQQGTRAQRSLAFAGAFAMIANRISAFVSLPDAALERLRRRSVETSAAGARRAPLDGWTCDIERSAA